MSILLHQYDSSTLQLGQRPQRVISLVPSITENLIQFGIMPIARTSFCIFPSEVVENIPVIGGTKTPRVQKIISMNPDLVIANLEENTKKDVEELQANGIKVWITFPQTVKDLVPLMTQLQSLSATQSMADPVIESIRRRLDQPEPSLNAKALVLIWKDPWMAVGQETYTSDLLHFCGLQNPLTGRYPVVSEEQILGIQPDVLILPSEPYPFGPEDHSYWNRSLPTILFNGEDLFWSGPRFLSAVNRLAEVGKALKTR